MQDQDKRIIFDMHSKVQGNTRRFKAPRIMFGSGVVWAIDAWRSFSAGLLSHKETTPTVRVMDICQKRNYLNYNENTFSPKQKSVAEVRSFLAWLGGAGREFHESYFERPCARDPNFAWHIFLYFPECVWKSFLFLAKICLLGFCWNNIVSFLIMSCFRPAMSFTSQSFSAISEPWDLPFKAFYAFFLIEFQLATSISHLDSISLQSSFFNQIQ